ncbi:uncharacterized protein LOC126377423 [Pectinophora gossypiella]|uniref:uncharacterized protein LOC126377423 n=1 Tax=Pectinophora gossypiella TaxID=13191 RepID=UPI00214E5930|nr:uncharacterized protein LOC126377423 [Pectinophora gossypiella]
MGVVSSLMYAAASVALLALVLECCCRNRLKRLRESPQILALNVVNSSQYPVVTPYPTGPVVTPYPPGPLRPPPPVAFPAQVTVAVPCPAYYPPAPNIQNAETPPPSYEQVMAGQHSVPAPR